MSSLDWTTIELDDYMVLKQGLLETMREVGIPVLGHILVRLHPDYEYMVYKKPNVTIVHYRLPTTTENKLDNE